MHNPPYTLITGASEGFGKALALECASRGMPVILVALPGESLRQLAVFIERNYTVSALYYEHDLTKKEECYSLYKNISEKGLQVQTLINNAGIGGTHLFEEKDASFYHHQIALNVAAPTLLTYFFLPLLQQHPHSYILNVSSMAGFFALPRKQVYGGTKSYLLAFSKSLRSELRHKQVHVSVVCPGGMNTTLTLIIQNRNLSGMSRWSVMDPEAVATVAIDGMLQHKEVIIPGKWNRFFMLLDKLMPRWIRELLINRQMRPPKASSIADVGDISLHPHVEAA
jgi:short-subunit dehydrogenase